MSVCEGRHIEYQMSYSDNQPLTKYGVELNYVKCRVYIESISQLLLFSFHLMHVLETMEE